MFLQYKINRTCIFRHRAAALLLVLCVFTGGTAWVYVAHEQEIYVWDFRQYWGFFQQYGGWLREDAVKAAQTAIEQIRGSDYHPLPIVPLLPIAMVLGDSRSLYISSLAVLYLLPTCVLLSRVVWFVERPAVRRRAALLALFLAVTYVSFWRPTLRGLPDIVGLLPILGATLLVLKRDFSANVLVWCAVAVGVLLWLPFGLRRWYAYTVITLYFSLPVLALMLGEAHDRLVRLRYVVVNFLVAGLVTSFCTLVVQWPSVLRILQADYSFLYSPYQFGRGSAIVQFLGEVGLYTLPLFLLGVLRAIKEKGVVRYFTGFCLLNLVVSFVLFTGTQSPGLHHNLPFSMWYLLVTVFGVVGFAQGLGYRGGMTLLGGYAALSLGALFTSQYGIAASSGGVGKTYQPEGLQKISLIMPEPFPPFRFENYDQYLALTDHLNRLVRADQKFAVVASSLLLNDQLLLTLSKGLLFGRLFPTPHSDMQNGLVPEILCAHYLVVADPIQIHLASGQDGVAFLATDLLKRRGVGAAYKIAASPYFLDDGVSVQIYQRVRPVTTAEAEKYVEHFYEKYPTWRAIYPKQEALDLIASPDCGAP